MAGNKNDFEESTQLHIWLLVLNIFNIVFHSTGGCVLYSIYKNSCHRKVR